MNPITNQQRDTAYEAATAQQLYLYEDPDSGQKLSNIATKHGITTATSYAAFAIAVGDVILGLVPQEKLPDLLVERLQITRPEAMKLTADLLDFLAQKAPQVAEAVSPDALAAEIAETEAALQSVVQPMRTMAHDMETARQPQAAQPTHQAVSQDQLLAGNQTKDPNASWNTTQS